MPTRRIDVPDAIKAKVLADAGYRCGNPQCPNELTQQVHHIVEVSEEGGNEPENLLPLCPYCHDKYHRRWIPQDAIQQWKKRLNDRNSPLDPALAAQVVSEVNKILAEKPDGFGAAAGVFAARTCRIGAERNGSVVTTGYGTFIDQGLMVTTDTVIQNVRHITNAHGGRGVVWSDVGLAEFGEHATSPLTHAVVIKVAEFDTQHAQEVAKESNIPFDLCFQALLQSKVRARHMPALGEAVGFLHSPACSEGFRPTGSFQFERSDVAYRLRSKDPMNMLDFALSQFSTRLEHAGSAVFNQHGVLLGVITGVSISDREDYPRPTVAGLLRLEPFQFF